MVFSPPFFFDSSLRNESLKGGGMCQILSGFAVFLPLTKPRDVRGVKKETPYSSTLRKSKPHRFSFLIPVRSPVGAGGFEPPTSRTRTVRSSRAEPRPVSCHYTPATTPSDDRIVPYKFYIQQERS